MAERRHPPAAADLGLARALPALVSMAVMAVALSVIVIVMVRRMTRPLAALAGAAGGASQCGSGAGIRRTHHDHDHGERHRHHRHRDQRRQGPGGRRRQAGADVSHWPRRGGPRPKGWVAAADAANGDRAATPGHPRRRRPRGRGAPRRHPPPGPRPAATCPSATRPPNRHRRASHEHFLDPDAGQMPARICCRRLARLSASVGSTALASASQKRSSGVLAVCRICSCTAGGVSSAGARSRPCARGSAAGWRPAPQGGAGRERSKS